MRKTIGKLLKKAREDKNLTQQDVADLMGYGTPQFVSNIERGISKIPDRSIKKVCELLGLQVEEIVDLLAEQRKQDLMRRVMG